MSHGSRSLVLARGPAPRRDVALEAAALRREVQTRYTEVDLLVAALQEHVQDLRLERDRLREEVAFLREEARHAEARGFFQRGLKLNRGREGSGVRG